jgi:proline iminopeptidase
LRVSALHELYFEECGNPRGKPAVFLHGGPGAGLVPVYRQAFDPARYRIVLFDQRGSGRSTPRGALDENTTWHHVADIEQLRKHLGIARWLVAGGSWGGTLALAYAQTHPERVTELILRGVASWRQLEHDWMYRFGANVLFPDAWDDFVAPIPPDERDDLVRAYYRRLTSTDAALRSAAARAWGAWESAIVSLVPDLTFVAQHSAVYEESLSLMECHYMVNGAWLRSDTQLIDDLHKICHIPAVAVFGRYDLITPVQIGWDMQRRWPELDLVVVPDAGHAFTEPGIARAMVQASDRFASA